jgi:hypothetical protein
VLLQVPKAASTSWVDTLLPRFGYDIRRILIGWRHKLLRKHMPQPTDAHNVSGYFSFVTVRHPFQKLVSAYRYRPFLLTLDYDRVYLTVSLHTVRSKFFKLAKFLAT